MPAMGIVKTLFWQYNGNMKFLQTKESEHE